jgi:hypothetical protein
VFYENSFIKNKAMQNVYEGFRKATDDEISQISKMEDRGHETARAYLNFAHEADSNFTMAHVAIGKISYSSFQIDHMVSGAAKKHPEDKREQSVGRKIALTRAVKGNNLS